MTTAVAGVNDAPPRLSLRVAGLLALILVPTALGLVARNADARPVSTLLFHYSPDRFIHGRVWTLVLSGLVPPKLSNLGPNTIMMTLILVPYVLLRGAGRAVGRFFAGHVLSREQPFKPAHPPINDSTNVSASSRCFLAA